LTEKLPQLAKENAMEENSTLSKNTRAARERVNVRFVGESPKRDSNFGDFCLALTKDGFRFSVAGDRTIAIYRHVLGGLFGRARDLFASYQRNNEIEVESAQATGERLRKPREEAKERMRWYMENRR
jgi:hypothetical protein